MVADFGHGMLTNNIITKINQTKGIFKAVNSQTNSVNFGFNLVDRYKDIDFVCIDELEARLPSGDKQTDIEIIGESIKKDKSKNNYLLVALKDIEKNDELLLNYKYLPYYIYDASWYFKDC